MKDTILEGRNVLPQKGHSETSQTFLMLQDLDRFATDKHPALVPNVVRDPLMVIRWLLHLWPSRPHSRQEKEGRVKYIFLETFAFNSGRETFPLIFCLQLMGQKWVTCLPQSSEGRPRN